MQRNLPQNKEALLKSYTTRLKEDVKSMLENFEGMKKNLMAPLNSKKYWVYSLPIVSFSEIIKLAKLENESQLNRMTQIEQDTFEMQVRAANIGKTTVLT